MSSTVATDQPQGVIYLPESEVQRRRLHQTTETSVRMAAQSLTPFAPGTYLNGGNPYAPVPAPPPGANRVVVPDLVEIGQIGLSATGGQIRDFYDPSYTGPGLRRWIRMMVEQDSTVGAVMFMIEMLVRAVTWTVQPPEGKSGNRQARKMAEFVQSCFGDLSTNWSDTLSEILTFIPWGHSAVEIVYKQRGGLMTDDPTLRSRYDDNLIGWRKLAPRPQDTILSWAIDPQGGVKGFWQQAPPTYEQIFIPIQKLLLFRTTSRKGNPEGRSVFLSAKRVLDRKWKFEDLEGIGIERDLAGLPIAWIPPQYLAVDASPDKKALLQQVENIVQNVKRDTQEGIVFPLLYDDSGHKLFDFTLLSASGQRQFNVGESIDRSKREAASVLLADFIMMGHEKIGSFAMSNDKTRMFSAALSAWLDAICAVFNSYGIPRLMQQNPNFDPSLAPVLMHSDIEKRDLQSIGEYISNLSKAGVAAFAENPEVVEYLLRIADIPIPAGGLKMTAPQPIQAPAPQAPPNPDQQVPAPGTNADDNNAPGSAEGNKVPAGGADTTAE